MAPEAALKTYMERYWEYQHAIGHAELATLHSYEAELHRLWVPLDEKQKLTALTRMVRMIAS